MSKILGTGPGPLGRPPAYATAIIESIEITIEACYKTGKFN